MEILIFNCGVASRYRCSNYVKFCLKKGSVCSMQSYIKYRRSRSLVGMHTQNVCVAENEVTQERYSMFYWIRTNFAQCYDVIDLILQTSKCAEPELRHSFGANTKAVCLHRFAQNKSVQQSLSEMLIQQKLALHCPLSVWSCPCLSLPVRACPNKNDHIGFFCLLWPLLSLTSFQLISGPTTQTTTRVCGTAQVTSRMSCPSNAATPFTSWVR